MNKVILSGRLTKHPEIRYTTTGKAVASFTLAVNRKGKDQPADFIPCIVWDKLAEVCDKYLDKGSKILIEGRIQVRSYQAQDGSKRYATEVIVNEWEFAESKKETNGAPAPNPNMAPSDNQKYFGQPANEEIPF